VNLRGRRRTRGPAGLPQLIDTVDPSIVPILEEIRPYTMTSVERQVALLDAVDHAVANDVPGAFVECGVWRGGSVLAMIRRLQHLGAPPRHIHLFDTFEGMTAPTDADVSDFHPPASETWARSSGRPWPTLFGEQAFGEDQVRSLLAGTGYPASHLHVVVGDVSATLREAAPDEVAVLRLDTDWYESTRDELDVLYPKLAVGGVLIVDDYGHWRGSRQAIDEYFARVPRPLLVAVDYTCRVGTKVVG